MKILAVDPGIGGSGWAVFNTKDKSLRAFGVLRGIAIHTWDIKGLTICQALELIEREHFTLKTYIEFPALFQSAHGQMIARKGDLVKLAWFTGLLYGRLIGAELIPVNEWKGQLPKNVVEERLRKTLGSQMKEAKSHAIDAIGIGMFAMGKF